ncbi:MAG TPA: hypothetical protein VMV92_12895, partial [Streptosporangiaceae bacterium]|nr:hypothetical protein [Streptosporangiaceae bacterium]
MLTANYVADSIDTGSMFPRKAPTDLAINGGTTLLFAGVGKIAGGVLSANSASEVERAFSLADREGWWAR